MIRRTKRINVEGSLLDERLKFYPVSEKEINNYFQNRSIKKELGGSNPPPAIFSLHQLFKC